MTNSKKKELRQWLDDKINGNDRLNDLTDDEVTKAMRYLVSCIDKSPELKKVIIDFTEDLKRQNEELKELTKKIH
jgi:hypothetical protein